MVAITPQSLRNSCRYALRGLHHTYRTQQSFRLQVFAAAAVIVVMLLLEVSRRDTVILIFMITAVLVLELINTVVEHLTDLVSARLSPVAQAVKDAMAAAVFVASIITLVVGLIIFWPYFAPVAP